MMPRPVRNAASVPYAAPGRGSRPKWALSARSRPARKSETRVRKELTEIWDQTRNAAAFKDAIENKGYLLANDSKRGIMVIDPWTYDRLLARQLDGVMPDVFNARMHTLDRDRLPSVAAAKEIQRAKVLERAATREGWKKLWDAYRADEMKGWTEYGPSGTEAPPPQTFTDFWRDVAADMTRDISSAPATPLNLSDLATHFLLSEDSRSLGSPGRSQTPPSSDRAAQSAGGHDYGQKGGVGVADAAAKGILTLAEFFTSFFDPAPARPSVNRIQQIVAEREHEKAIGRMSENSPATNPSAASTSRPCCPTTLFNCVNRATLISTSLSPSTTASGNAISAESENGNDRGAPQAGRRPAREGQGSGGTLAVRHRADRGPSPRLMPQSRGPFAGLA